MNSPARIGRQPPSFSGAPWPGSGSTPLPSIAGWAKPSAKPKCSVPPGRAEPGLVADHGDPAVALDRLAQLAVARGERGRVLRADHHQHVDLAAAERRLPALRGALADVAQRLGARRHPGAEVVGEATQRRARDAERLEPGVGEGDVDPRLGLRLPRIGGQHVRRRLGQQRAGARGVVDAQEQVARGGQPVAADHEALDRGELERLAHRRELRLEARLQLGGAGAPAPPSRTRSAACAARGWRAPRRRSGRRRRRRRARSRPGGCGSRRRTRARPRAPGSPRSGPRRRRRPRPARSAAPRDRRRAARRSCS